MPKISEEIEFQLDRLVEKRMQYNYNTKETNANWVYEDFAEWLVKKFKEETKQYGE